MVEQIQTKLIEEEMKENYVDYAMSVIVGRALPDARDGLKPVHRRILYALYKLGLLHNKAFKKSARVIGEVIAKYHPHGDMAVYDALVRMAQDFSLRYPLVQGQGNFGSIDGDAQAAYRYTEARLSKISAEILEDIEKDTVDFIPNFDNSEREPVVLPCKFPNLLINGSSGIAVGMATNIPPHNIREIIDACVRFIENQNISVQELLELIKGPDFPTGGILVNKQEMKKVYETGRGRMVVKAKTRFEDNSIIIEEIPYMLNKSLLIQNIADLVRGGRIESISDIRDESDREGIRIVIELKKGANRDLVLNNLMQNTQLRTSYGIIMLALVENQPRILNIRDLISSYVLHRKEVVTRRTRFDLREAEEKKHILEGIRVALDNIDEVVSGIKASSNAQQAQIWLIQNYNLTEMQANAILDMRLQRLTSLETEKVKKDVEELTILITNLKDILSSETKIYEIIKNELLEIKEKYGDDRKTVIIDEEEIILGEDLIEEQNIVVLVTRSGYIKQLPLNTYKQQRRGGVGIISAEIKEEDILEHIFVTSNLNYLTFFTNKGKIYWLKAYEIPEAGRYSKGRSIANLLKFEQNEKISAILPVNKFDNRYLIFATKKGMVKKTSLSEYGNVRQTGVIAINLRENDEVVDVIITNGESNLIIATKRGIANRFNEKEVSVVGRNATGVRGINLVNDQVIGMEIALPGSSILTVTENGYGKRTNVDEYRLTSRGSKGVINLVCNEKTGSVAAIKDVFEDDELIIVSEKGNAIRISVKDISLLGRNTQGVRLMKLENDKVASVEKIVKD